MDTASDTGEPAVRKPTARDLLLKHMSELQREMDTDVGRFPAMG